MRNGVRRRRFGRSLHGPEFGLALGLVGLGLLLAGALGFALHVVAFFLRDFIGGLHLFFLHIAGIAVAGLVLLLEFGLGHVFLALGFLLADVVGIALQAVAA